MQFERWSLPLIAEAILRGTSRREEFRSFLGIAPALLDSRLRELVAAGILSTDVDAEGIERFLPTPKGRGLEPAIRALDRWSRDWDPLSTGELPDDGTVGAAPEDIPTPASMRMSVLGTFDLRIDGVPVALSPGSQRLLVLLALRDRAIARIVLAGTMWPDVSDGHAGDSLRSAIARLEPEARATLTSSTTGLRLADAVAVDLRDAQALAARLLQDEGDDADLSSASITELSRDLLPDWYDEWIIAEAEDWRHLRMNALDALGLRLLDAGMLALAATAARAAIRIDPLRETPQATLIRVQLAMGNQAAAVEVFDRYRTLLDAALGQAPTKQLGDLVAAIAY